MLASSRGARGVTAHNSEHQLNEAINAQLVGKGRFADLLWWESCFEEEQIDDGTEDRGDDGSSTNRWQSSPATNATSRRDSSSGETKM